MHIASSSIFGRLSRSRPFVLLSKLDVVVLLSSVALPHRWLSATYDPRMPEVSRKQTCFCTMSMHRVGKSTSRASNCVVPEAVILH